MIALNINMVAIGIAVTVLLVLYLIHKQLRKTQNEVNGLKKFSNVVAQRFAAIAPPPTAPVVEEEEEKEEKATGAHEGSESAQTQTATEIDEKKNA
tara:strand:+ start:4342 stop:4629 length:288 start_codon:yes stop_codon:yes gene_type:complete